MPREPEACCSRLRASDAEIVVGMNAAVRIAASRKEQPEEHVFGVGHRTVRVLLMTAFAVGAYSPIFESK